MEDDRVHEAGDGTPDWSLKIPECHFQMDANFQAECEKERAQSLGYFKPKASYLGEHTQVSEFIAEPTLVQQFYQDGDENHLYG